MSAQIEIITVLADIVGADINYTGISDKIYLMFSGGSNVKKYINNDSMNEMIISICQKGKSVSTTPDAVNSAVFSLTNLCPLPATKKWSVKYIKCSESAAPISVEKNTDWMFTAKIVIGYFEKGTKRNEVK